MAVSKNCQKIVALQKFSASSRFLKSQQKPFRQQSVEAGKQQSFLKFNDKCFNLRTVVVIAYWKSGGLRFQIARDQIPLRVWLILSFFSTSSLPNNFFKKWPCTEAYTDSCKEKVLSTPLVGLLRELLRGSFIWSS